MDVEEGIRAVDDKSLRGCSTVDDTISVAFVAIMSLPIFMVEVTIFSIFDEINVDNDEDDDDDNDDSFCECSLRDVTTSVGTLILHYIVYYIMSIWILNVFAFSDFFILILLLLLLLLLSVI